MTTKISSRYAKALFNSADKARQASLLKDFENVQEIFSKVSKLSSFLNSPEISRQKKEDILNIPFKDEPEFLRFLFLLLQKGRFKFLPGIAKEYRHIFTHTYGKTEAILTTATSLDDSMKERFQEKLEKTYNKQFELVCDVDPKIIGGGVLVIANQMIDFSVKDKLDRLKSHLEKS